MIKRVNFTGRRRLPRDRIDIEVFDGIPRRFAAAIDLSEMELPEDAGVFVEATCAGSTVIQRFGFGTVGKLKPEAPCLLTDIEGENVFFSIKVVDHSEKFGRLLRVAENVRPQRAGKQTAAGRRGILPIEPVDLGQELWQLEFREHDVFLLVNRQLPDFVDYVRSDPAFHAVVYPEIVRQILTKAIHENAEADEDDDRWPVMWSRFGRSLHPMREPAPDENEGIEVVEDWVSGVVRAFCAAHSLKDRFQSHALNDREVSQ
jgi:hypothetical protein